MACQFAGDGDAARLVRPGCHLVQRLWTQKSSQCAGDGDAAARVWYHRGVIWFNTSIALPVDTSIAPPVDTSIALPVDTPIALPVDTPVEHRPPAAPADTAAAAPGHAAAAVDTAAAAAVDTAAVDTGTPRVFLAGRDADVDDAVFAAAAPDGADAAQGAPGAAERRRRVAAAAALGCFTRAYDQFDVGDTLSRQRCASVAAAVLATTKGHAHKAPRVTLSAASGALLLLFLQ